MKNANITFNEGFKEIEIEFNDTTTVALYFENDDYGPRFSLVYIENGHVVEEIMCHDYGNIVKILSLVQEHGWNDAMNDISQIVHDDWEESRKAR